MHIIYSVVHFDSSVTVNGTKMEGSGCILVYTKVCQLFLFILFLGIRNGCTRRLTTHLAWNTASFISTQPGAIPTDPCQGQK